MKRIILILLAAIPLLSLGQTPHTDAYLENRLDSLIRGKTFQSTPSANQTQLLIDSKTSILSPRLNTTSTTNYVWTATDNLGNGSWQAPAASGGTVTSVSFTGGLISVADPTTTPALTVAGTSGGIPYFSGSSTWASSAALTANDLMIGGGAGVAPSTTTTGSGVLTFLGTPSWTNFNSMVTGTAPYVALSGTSTATGTMTLALATNPLIFTSGVTTGTGATAGHQISGTALTTGVLVDIGATTTTSGTLLNVVTAGTAINHTFGSTSVGFFGTSGANANTGRTAIAVTGSATNSGSSSTNIGLVGVASGGNTNYGVIGRGTTYDLFAGVSGKVMSDLPMTVGTTNTNLLALTTNNVNRSVWSAAGLQTHTMTNQSSGTGTFITWTAPANTNQTASTEETMFNFIPTSIQFATGALTTQRFGRFQSATLSFVGTSTATTASNFSFGGPVIAGTNATLTSSIGVNIEAVAVNGGGTVTTAYGLVVNPPTGATNNYAAHLNGTTGVNTSPNASYSLSVGAGFRTITGAVSVEINSNMAMITTMTSGTLTGHSVQGTITTAATSSVGFSHAHTYNQSSGTPLVAGFIGGETYNFTGSVSGGSIYGFRYTPTLTSMTGITTHLAWWNNSGGALFNGATITASTAVDMRGISSGSVLRLANSSNTERFDFLDDGSLQIGGSAGTATYVLTSAGAGAPVTWSPVSAIGGSTGLTDNAVLRADGTGGSTLQSSGVVIDDSDVVSAAGFRTGSLGSGGYGYQVQQVASSWGASTSGFQGFNSTDYGNNTVLYAEAVVVGMKSDGTAAVTATVNSRFRKDNSGTWTVDSAGTATTSDATVVTTFVGAINGAVPGFAWTSGAYAGTYTVGYTVKLSSHRY